jgi:hypothetical protein
MSIERGQKRRIQIQFFLCSVDRAFLYNLVNKASLVHNLFLVYLFLVHLTVYVPIIRRKNCVYVTLGTCYSVWMTVWYAGWKDQVSQKHSYFS